MLFEVPVDHFPVQRAERPQRPQILLRIPQITLHQQEVSAAVEPQTPSGLYYITFAFFFLLFSCILPVLLCYISRLCSLFSVCRSQFNFCSASTSSSPRFTRKAFDDSLSAPAERRRCHSCPSVRPLNSRPSTQPSTPSRLFQRSPLLEQFRRLFSSVSPLQQLA